MYTYMYIYVLIYKHKYQLTNISHTYAIIQTHIYMYIYFSFYLYVEKHKFILIPLVLTQYKIPQCHSTFLTFHIYDPLVQQWETCMNYPYLFMYLVISCISQFSISGVICFHTLKASSPCLGSDTLHYATLFLPPGRSPYHPLSWSLPYHPPYGSHPLLAEAQTFIMGSSPSVGTLFTLLRPWTPIPGWSSHEAQLTLLELRRSIETAPHGNTSLPCLGSDTLLWTMGAAPTPTWVPTCSAKKEKVLLFCIFILTKKEEN